MDPSLKSRNFVRWWVFLGLAGLLLRSNVNAEPISLQALVTPSTVIVKDGQPVTFAVHGIIEFKSLAELFPYVESQTRRWKTSAVDAEAVHPAIRRRDLQNLDLQNLGDELLRRGIESRVISMADE